MDYDREAQLDVAAELAPKAKGGVGQVVTLTIASERTRDDDTGKWSAGVPVTQTGSGIEKAYRAHEIDGQRVLATDIKFLLSPLDDKGRPITTAKIGAVLTLENGVAHRVMDVGGKKPTGLPLIFELQLRA